MAGLGRPGHQPEADEVVAAQRLRLVQRQIAQLRHAVVLDLPVAQRAGLVRLVAHQRLQQPGPVGGDARRAVAADMGHEQLALVGIGLRQHLPVVAQPLGAGQAVQRLPVRVPAGRVAAAEAVHQFLRLGQRQVVGADFDIQQHQIEIEEKIQIDVRDGRA